MEITKFVLASREKAILYGDYGSYRTQLSGRLLNTRKKLKIATKNRAKYQPKPDVGPEQIADSPEYLHLQLLTAERSWAQALAMKAAHTADTRGISAHTRSHIVSRLDKAAKTAENLAGVLAESASGATEVDILEARAYAALIRGAAQFERKAWESCLHSYAVARIIYSALSTDSRADIFKDLLSETIDPSIRYAAYQLKTPRSLPIPAIARKAFPHSDSALVASINKIDPHALEGEKDDKKGLPSGDNASRTLKWRSREVRIEDAAIATAWTGLDAAKKVLHEKVTSSESLSDRDLAAAYDEVLIVSQDAVDATKQAIDELRAEGVSQSDPRMQSLYITRTAVNYEMISWRIGRNRVLTGEHDGAPADSGRATVRRSRKRKADDALAKPDPPSRQLTRLKEKIVLYDGALQSLETIKELPGVAADEEFSSKLDGTWKYFNALKCLAVARSHTIAGSPANALALINLAAQEMQHATKTLSTSAAPSSKPVRDVEVSQEDLKFLAHLLRSELQRGRALVDIEKSSQATNTAGGAVRTFTLGDRLGQYPAQGVDLDHIVTYPPQLEPIPVKPIFLDIAWNYIDYPSKTTKAETKSREAGVAKAEPDQKPAKKGWFGFGR